MSIEDFRNTEIQFFVPIKSYCHLDLHVGNLIYELSRKLSRNDLDKFLYELQTYRNYLHHEDHMSKFLKDR